MSEKDCNDVTSLFFNEKPVEILLEVERSPLGENGTYASEIQSKVGTTYAHTVNVVDKLERNGLVKSKKKGRKKHLSATEKGKKVAKEIRVAWKTTEEVEE